MTATAARPVSEFMNDPIGFFGQSYTRMHSVDRHELEGLQREAMGIRFREHYDTIEMLRKLADRLGITALDEFNDVAPLMFSHTAFKSYPAVLIDKKRFDLMTKWLDKLTSNDLSEVDTSGCTGIDDWIDRLDEQTPLEVITSSALPAPSRSSPKTSAGPKRAWCYGRSAYSRPSARSRPKPNSTRRWMWSGPTSPTASSDTCASPI